MNRVRTETAPVYNVTVDREEEILKQAMEILERRSIDRGEPFTSPDQTKAYFRMRFSGLEHEVFAVAFLDNRHRLIACEDMFRGTVNGAAVYPREVVKEAMKHNAAAVFFAHNHPSGVAEPSGADRAITDRLREALALLDVQVLDHLVVGDKGVTSFAERGLL